MGYDLFSNIVYVYDEDGTEISENQSFAAAKNRQFLTRLLMGIEKLFNGEIIEYTAESHYTKGSDFKYGIKETAVIKE